MVYSESQPRIAYAIDCDRTILDNNPRFPADILKYILNLEFPLQAGVVQAFFALQIDPTADLRSVYTVRPVKKHYPTVANLVQAGLWINKVVHTPGHNGVGSRRKVQQVVTDLGAAKDEQGNPLSCHGQFVPDENVARIVLIDDDAKHIVQGVNYLSHNVPALAPLLGRFTFIHFNPQTQSNYYQRLAPSSSIEFLEMRHWDELPQIHAHLAENYVYNSRT